jgi:hypothetical protein
MAKTKVGKGAIQVSTARTARMADRLWRMSQAKRDYALSRAKERLAGPHPSKRDAAIAMLAD